MDRYAPQIAVADIGAEGQLKLASAKVCIIGAGGLGTPVATILAAAGVGFITIIDGDRVALSNLHRQFQFTPADIGKSKAEVLAAQLRIQSPGIDVAVIAEHLTDGNAEQLLSSADAVADCTDQLESRLLVDRMCGLLNKPLVFAAVGGWEGYLTILHHRQRFALAQAFDLAGFYADAVLDCARIGIVPTTCGVVGNLQANEVLKVILGLADVLDGQLLCVDLKQVVFRKFALKKPG